MTEEVNMRNEFLCGLIAALTSIALGCGADCVEGATQACACLGGLTGVQACSAEGTYGACDCGQLSEATARSLVEAQADFADGVMCGVQVNEVSHGRYGISMFQQDCIDALEAAGLAVEGGCAVDTCGEHEVRPTERSRVQGIYLRFRCGTVSLAAISGITTSGNQATFRYEREVTLDHSVVDAVSACRLDVAEEGRATRERTARRDDSGQWSLANPSR